ncbi:hypothetical protein LTR10_022458 [Elasticomyces elasticus]|uniref:Cytochrome P450 n=1 Tax=Exophiala sideris TaxID=1016849 RepID=A0ABR0J2J5_9EURO|nr:hypothetical protein LTR10_022458 [Elasticomyces elasticus]KAK5024894.1 hypothetical protein LTS07_008272 [Exophiala sideris]KAK5031516.1 hypothetical protein LTR13_007844 [Exophiala sideris]KAK5054933.1 hypothetical protein LTR69_008501 [Exophiala sideris]KAK5179812.1 hypothetical protein LTR44_007628 [Eurotiomycetes sp. CCFEE 6388]
MAVPTLVSEAADVVGGRRGSTNSVRNHGIDWLLFGPAIILLLWGLKLAASACYNVILHPLKRIPGPWPAKVMPFYLTSAEAKLDRAQVLLKLHRKYGSSVRIGPNEVSIGDWRLYREIYGGSVPTRKTHSYDIGNFLGHHNIFSFIDKAQHRARRKMQSQPYSLQAIYENEPLIASKADVMVRRMIDLARQPTSGGTVEAYRLCGLFSLEVILKCAFNREYGEAIDGESWEFLQAMDEGAMSLAIRTVVPFLKPSVGRRLPGFVGHAFHQFDKWHSMTSKLCQDFMRTESSMDKTQRFLTTPLLTNKDDYLGRKLTQGEVDEEAMGIAFAGSGTTSTTMTYLLYALSRPEGQRIQKTLRLELNTAGETLRELQDLPYLNAVIKETMRVFPTIISTLPRILEAPLTINDNLVLPAGTVVGMQNLVHHQDPDLFPEPEKFLPERWLDAKANKDMNTALTPFSIGTRNCLGQNLARAEVYLATAKVFKRLSLTLSELMTVQDMKMDDRFNVVPHSRKLLLNVEAI